MGRTAADIEVWSLGKSGDSWYVNSFAMGSPGACFEDDFQGSGARALNANSDDVVILDRGLTVRMTTNMGYAPVTNFMNRQNVENTINGLL